MAKRLHSSDDEVLGSGAEAVLVVAFEYEGTPLFKAAKSGNGGCVSVGTTGGDGVAIGDSKNTDKPPHRFSRYEWRVFRDAVKAGAFDKI
jgi:hypothetical protein